MASMVAKACCSTSTQMPVLTVPEKGSRNKRKFRADPPLAHPDKIIPLPQTDCPSFDISTDQFEAFTTHDHTNGCDMCCLSQENTADALKLNLGLPSRTSKAGPSRPREELEPSLDADWNDLTESQLQELLLSNLDSIFKSAIKKIICSGYSEEVANRAILRSALWYGCKDMVSNIVENTLAFLNSSGQEVDSSREHYFEDLKQMEKYILAELVCLLREVRPFFSTGDAMWCLLISDMNVSHACAMDSDSLGSFFCSDASNENSDISRQQRQLGTELDSSSDPNTMFASNPPLVTYARRSETSNVTPLFNALMNPQAPPTFGTVTQENEGSTLTTPHVNGKLFNAMGLSHSTAHEKFVGGSRKASGIAKRDYILRQKSLHFEKYHHHHRTRGSSRSGKLSSFGGLVVDKKLKALSDSSTKNPTTEINSAVPFNARRENASNVLSSGNGFPLVQERNGNRDLSLPLAPVNTSPSLSAADTELSLSLPSKTSANPMPVSFSSGSNSILSSKGKSTTWAPRDGKDEIVAHLSPRLQELQDQLRKWTEWANERVMQAARRLSQDKDELKALRLEREEAERLKKEQQTSEESSLKKLAEIENALRKASGQVQRANAAVRRREIENASLRRELEDARLRAAESAANCDEVVKREKALLGSLLSSEKQKMACRDELAAEKRKLMSLQKTLQQAKDARYQAEGKLNQEEGANTELLNQVNAVKRQREQIEASNRSQEDSIKLRAETNLQKYKDDIMKLEKEISQLRLKKDSSKIAALKRGIDGKVQDALSSKDSAVSYVSKMTDLPSAGGVRRDRECVMCLSEEMSVVFLPCAHQVVCTACNELHEKQGMKDCPSCRTLIRRRVPVRYSR